MPTKLAADLLHFTETVDCLDTPEAILDTLDKITWQPCRAHVLGASLLPLNFGTTALSWASRFSCTAFSSRQYRRHRAT